MAPKSKGEKSPEVLSERISFRSPKNGVKKLDAKLHSLPCRVHHTGPAPVSNYFKVEELKNGNKATTFRGRFLLGEELTNLPPSYSIFVAREDKTDSAKVIHVEGKLRSLYSWDFDEEPEEGNGTALSRSLGFLEIAEKLAADENRESQSSGKEA